MDKILTLERNHEGQCQALVCLCCCKFRYFHLPSPSCDLSAKTIEKISFALKAASAFWHLESVLLPLVGARALCKVCWTRDGFFTQQEKHSQTCGAAEF